MSRRQSLTIRVGLGLMILDHVQNGLRALLDPSGFYRLLPGSHAVDSTDTFTRLMTRDLGAARLTLAFVLLASAVWMTRRVLAVGLGAATISGVIRLLDHALSGPRAEGWMSWFGYSAAVVIPIALVFVARLLAHQRDGGDSLAA
jgi:hypothetical protein